MRMIVLTVLLALLTGSSAVTGVESWPGWRGDGSGISTTQRAPLHWDEATNIAWRAALPGEGNSSPIVWDGRIYLTAAEGWRKRSVICLEAQTGAILWQCAIEVEEETKTYPKTGFAASTPVTDGRYIYALFDRPGLVCVDVDGNLVWTRPLGNLHSMYNVATSPILYDDSVIVCCDHNGDSFIAAFSKTDGAVRWRTGRPTSQHFATPLLVHTSAGEQIVTNAKVIRSYRADNGELLWTCREMRPCVSPSPVYRDGLVYVTSGRNGPTVVVDPAGRGDITETHVKVHLGTGGPYVPSPLVYPLLMLPSDNGMMRFVNADGEIVAKERVRDVFSSSPVGAAGRIYWVSERGKTYVIDAEKLGGATPQVELLATNVLEGRFLASPAVVQGRLYLRSDKELYCIAETGARRKTVQKQDDQDLTGKTFDELKTFYDAHQAPIDNDEEVKVRLTAVTAMSKLDDPRVLGFLVEAVKKEHWDISEEAMKLLHQDHGEAAVGTFIELVRDNRPFIRGLAVENLGRLQAAEAADALVKAAGDKNSLIRSAAMTALGQIAVGECVEDEVWTAFLGGLGDSDGLVREMAIGSLRSLTEKVSADQREEAIAALRERVGDENPRVAAQAAEVLERFETTEGKAECAADWRIIRYDEKSQLIPDGTRLEVLYEHNIFFEGPCWDPLTEKLYFVAWDGAKQFLRLDKPGKVTVCVDDPNNQIGINGSFITEPGRMITAQVFAHKVVAYRVTAEGLTEPQVLAHDDTWMQPNDLCMRSDGTIYFSDPQWGGDHSASAVYLRRPDGTVVKIIDDLLGPNGLILSPDGKTLYVADSLQKCWTAYPVNADGSIGPGRLFYQSGDEGGDVAAGDLPDGMAIDPMGNVYLTGLGGVRIVAPDGTLLWMIQTKQKASNVTLGGKDGDKLFITCRDVIYGLGLNLTP